MTTIVDGKLVAQEIARTLRTQVQSLDVSPILDIVTVGNDAVTASFVRSKKRFAHDIGVTCREHNFPTDIQEAELVAEIKEIAAHARALIIQLPLPEHISKTTVLDTLETAKDVDVLSESSYAQFLAGESQFVPPVAGAVLRILEKYNVAIKESNVAVIGNGRLVGAPTSYLLKTLGAHVTTIDSKTSDEDFKKVVIQADIVITGVGKPDFIQPEMIQEGVVLIDAGTSTAARVLRGDAAPECEEKASIFSPTPGGVGPVTVAVLFENVLRAWV